MSLLSKWQTVCCSGTTYSTGMILAHSSTGGLPDFVELIQIVVVHGKVSFIVKCLNAWYTEHFRRYELENTRSVKVTEPHDLSDIFPLAAYTVAGKPMVTLKRYHLCAIDGKPVITPCHLFAFTHRTHDQKCHTLQTLFTLRYLCHT